MWTTTFLRSKHAEPQQIHKVGSARYGQPHFRYILHSYKQHIIDGQERLADS